MDFKPFALCTLPNGNLLITSQTAKTLTIWDSNYKIIKVVDKINNQNISPRYVTTNNRERVYVTVADDRVIQMDLDFNFINEFDKDVSGKKQLKLSLDIAYYSNSLYICDAKIWI